MEGKTPKTVYDALDSLGTPYDQPRAARATFGGNGVLKAWYNDVEAMDKRLGLLHGFGESHEKDAVARTEILQLLNQYGAAIWGRQNPQCIRIQTDGSNVFYQQDLFFPEDTEKLVEKHLKLLHCKWACKHRSGRYSAPGQQKKRWRYSPSSSPSDIDDPVSSEEEDQDLLDDFMRTPDYLEDELIDSDMQDVIHIRAPISRRRKSRVATTEAGRATQSTDSGITDINQDLRSFPNRQTAVGDKVGHSSSAPQSTKQIANQGRQMHSSASTQDAQEQSSVVYCPFNGNCPSMSEKELSAHKKLLHFRCSSCLRVFPQSRLQEHLNEQTTHNQWDLLPAKPREAKGLYYTKYQSSFKAQGYAISVEVANNLCRDDANSILQVRKQVDETVLAVLAEGSRNVKQAYLQHCYQYKDLVCHIAEVVGVEYEEIELLQVLLQDDFDYNVKEGDLIAIFDDATYKGFIDRIERAWRRENGDARMLWFLCEVYLRQD